MKRKTITILVSLLTLGATGSIFAAGACCPAPGAAKSAEADNPARMILASYEKVSNALAADDLAQAQAAARTFAAVADITAIKLDCGEKKECGSESASAKKDCDAADEGCTKGLQALIEAKDIEEARAHFKLISAQAIKLAAKEEGYLVMTCPMAGENGDWVQTSEEVRNPYLGSKMLRCGKVKSSAAVEG